MRAKAHQDPFSGEAPTAPVKPQRRPRTSKGTGKGSAAPRGAAKGRSKVVGTMVGTAEAAKLLGVTAATVRQMCRDGQLPGERNARGAWQVPTSALG